MLKFTIFIVSLVFLNCIFAAPLSKLGGTCKQGCPSTSKGSKLKYQIGQLYSYNFDSTISISLTGNEPQDIQLQVQGTAHVHGISNCQYGLDVQDVTLIGPDKLKSKFNSKLQLSKIVQFTLADDKLEPEICASPDDSDVSLNIKRALISLLQLNDGSTDEIDVFGKCHTNYAVVQQDDGSYVVTKTRDLNTCSYRENFVNGIITGVFNENSNVKSTPLLSGDYTNEIRVNKNGIVESAQVVEDYTLVPFQNGEAGLKARVVTALRFKEQKANGGEKASVSVPRPLIYEIVEKPQAVNYKIAKKSLFDICDTYTKRKNSVGAQVAGQFTETIRLLRYLKKDDILLLFKEASQLKDNPVCRKVFLDAVFRVGTADSVNAIASLLENNKIHEKRLAYLSFNLATSVNKETLTILSKLLDKEHFKEGYLSVGNLIKKYTQNGGNDDAELHRLFDKLAEKLGSCKSEKRQHEDIIVAILKGLRGAKGVSGSLVDKLIACTNDGTSGRVRTAAIQALSSASEDSKIQTAALNLLKNRKDDSEFRIEAYLVLVENSSPQIAGEILKLLEDEPVNQVGSFIVSHLSNLRSSTDLYREKARKDFADVFSSKKFPSDIRKYSFNHEFSYEFGSLGLGGSVDSNVIYSQKSFVPRSLRSNLTGEIFGTSFNFLEINARQENFDLILERYFGPKGYFNTLNKQDTIDKIHSMFSGESPKRHKRALSQDSEQFAKDHVGNNNRDVDFDVSVKMFGSELYFLSLGDNFPAESKDFTKEFGKWVQHFLKASRDGKKNQYDVHSLFFDAEFSYPTSSGFPLKVQSQGAGAFHLEASLKADFKDMQANPKNTKFSVSIVPSYNIEVTGIVSVDGYEVSTGVKVTSNVHSSTGSQMTFELLKEGKGVDFKIDFPQKKQEILSFDHKIVFIQQNLGHESIEHSLKASQKKDLSDNNYCFDQVNKYLGVTVCFEYSSKKKGDKLVNSRLFPLNGPLHVSAYVEIEKQYHFSALYDDSNPQKRNIELIFNTPNSQPNRKIAINFEGAIHPKAYLSASVTSPYKSADAEVGVTNDEKELVLYGQANSDSSQYLLKLGFQKTGSGSRLEYIPLIQYNSPESIPYKVSGKVIVDKTQPNKPKYIFEKLTIEPTQKDGKFGPLVIDGPLELNSQGFDTALDIKYKTNSANIKGKASASKNALDADLSLLTDFNELANGRIKVNYLASEQHLKNSVVLIYGRDLESTSKRLEFSTDYEYEKQDNKYTSVSGKNTIIISPIPVKFVVNGSIRKGHVDYEFLAEVVKHKISSNLNADVSKKVSGDWNIKFDAKANEHSIDFASTRDIDGSAQKSSVKHELQTSFGTHIVINAKFDNVFSAQKADFVSDGTIVVARGQKPLKYDFKFLIQPKVAQTSGKVILDSTELVNFNAVLNRNGNDANTPVTSTVDVSVPEFVTAHGEYHRLKGDGKMEFILSFPKFKRKLKVDSTFNYGANKLDLHNDFYYNYETDNSRLVAFDSKNKYTSTSFDSVNSIDINGNKYQFEIDATRSGDYQTGKQNGKFTIRLPTQREIGGVLNRQTDFKSSKASGHANFKLTDTISQGGRKVRSVEFDGTLKDGNREQRLFDLVHKITLTDFDGKQIVLDSHVNHLPKGDFKSALAAVKLSGSIPQPVEFTVAIKEYCAVHAVFNNNFKYGNVGSLDLNGDYYVGETGVKPTTFKLNGEVAIPQSKLKQLSFDTRGSLKLPNLKTDPNGKIDYDFKFNGKLNEKNAAVDTKGKFGKSSGDLSLNVKLPEIEPFATDIDYSYDEQPEQYHGAGNVQVRYGNGKNIKFSGDGKVIEGKEISYHGSINSPYEKAKSISVSFKSQKKEDNSYGLDAGIDIDDKKYKLSNVIVLSQINPSFSLDVYYPQDKHSKIAVVTNRVGDNKYKLSVHLENINNFHLNGDVELSYYSLENFGLMMDLDAPALKANKLHVDIHTKQNGNNKGIEFVITEQSKNVISGMADYAIKQEKGKTTIEGKGNVNWYDKSSTLTFQFMRSTFNQAENNETGFSLVFNGQIGPKNVQAELKLTNKEFHLQHTICESDKPCIHLKIESSLSELEWKRFTHNLLVSVDLRPIGFAHEFNLKAYTKREGYAIEHTFDTQIQTADQHKYQFNAYVKPQHAGIALSIPKRTAAVEAVFTYPKEFIGVYQATITSYLDKKNDPSKHSTIGFKGEIKRPTKYTFVSVGSLIASHPSVKDLKISGESEFNGEKQLISGNIKFDVFKNTNQAITVAAKFGNIDAPSKGFNITSEISLKSQGLGLNYAFIEIGGVSYARRAITYVYELRGPTAKDRFGVYMNADLKKADASIAVFNEDVLKATAQIDTDKRQLSLQSAAKLLDSDPANVDLSISLRSANAHIKQGTFISIEAEAAIGKALSLKASGNQKELVNVNVALDKGHLLSTTYTVNDKEFKEFLKNARGKLMEDGKRARNAFETRINQAKQSLTTQVNSIKDNLPDFTKLNADYKEEFEKFSEDLLADKSIKELVDLFQNTYKILNQTIGELLRTLMAHFNQISKTITDFFKNLYDGFNERILPSLKDSYNQIEKVLMDLFDELLSSAANLFERLVESLKKFENEWKQISESINDATKKASKFLGEQLEALQRELEDIYKLIVDYCKSLPGFDVIKEKYQELLQRIPHSDSEEIKKYLAEAMKKLKEWMEILQKQMGALGIESIEDYYNLPMIWVQKNVQFLPQLSTLKFSIVNYALHEPLPSLKDLLLTYRPYAFNPLHFVPPFPIEGRIVAGEYLFTFTGDQFTLPGSCHYVLAKDMDDGNFTIVAKINDKKLQSIAIADKSGESIEINESGKVSVNDKPTEYPVHEQTLYAWRTYYSISLLSTYGVHIQCKLDLQTCSVKINGYYFSKLRGLLGKGGYENFDARTLPNGKISDTLSQFANAYRLHSCPEVAIDEHHTHADDAPSVECENVFGSGSSLRFGKYILDSSKYIEACNHAVKSAANKQEAACKVAFGYASYAHAQNIPLKMPNICQKCEITEDAGTQKSYEIGDHFKVNTGKKADIVFVVDTAIETKSLKELVQHFIAELRHPLKKDYDTKISVIGYKRGNKYFSHYTSDGQLDVDKFHLARKPENEVQEDKLISVGCKYLDPIVQTLYNASIKVQDELSLLADGRAFREALSYPFRANAHRTIIAIRSNILEHSSNPIKLLGAKAVNEIAQGMGINIHLLGPTPDLKFDNNKEVNNVVGFNDKNVLYMPGQKARSQDREHLQYGLDLGIDMIGENHGYAFSLTNYNALNAPEQRKFLKVAAQSITQQITKEDTVHDCVCTLYHGLFAREVCRSADRK